MNLFFSLYVNFIKQKKMTKTIILAIVSFIILMFTNVMDKEMMYFEFIFNILVIINIIVNLNIYFQRKP